MTAAGRHPSGRGTSWLVLSAVVALGIAVAPSFAANVKAKDIKEEGT
jgi:hypothetical protein